jgi:hypothetical protein
MISDKLKENKKIIISWDNFHDSQQHDIVGLEHIEVGFDIAYQGIYDFVGLVE